jgi:tetratricopeptide (TPR) repeat protein
MDPDAPVVQKKMADCHMLLHDEAQALDARRALFQNYKPGSSWWNATSDEKSRTEAYRLCEQALRDNFNAHVRKAETPPGDTLSYAQAVRTARTYLESFPEDPNALPVRWNLALVLDTKLGRFKDALLEYLTISMAYTGDAYVSVAREKGLPSAQDAAENAIVMADSLARREAHGVPPDAEQPKDRVRNGSGQSVVPFSEAEKWLAMAYDNYIKQFPFDSKTQDILANAGVLYFSHYEYNDALRYFKTLVKNFPNAAQIEKVRYSILQSYLGNNDFGSAELLAKKVLQENPPAAELALWGLALGQSIFKNAEDLSRRNEAKAAGDEFYRMVLETPKVDFADRALFNAGREYEKIRDFNSAIRAYERLRIAYPSSPLLADALTNLAFDYGERGDALLCANRYEELAVLVRDGNRAKDALFNALLFYIKAEQWNKAVDLGELYGMRYPEAEDAPAIAFRAAEHCARIPDSVRAARMWSDFPLRFPRSGLGVEAYYRLGVSASDQEAAERWFVRSVSRHDSLVAVGLPGNLRIASEALYAACRLRQARFERIRFTLPDASMQEQVQGKQSLLQQLTEGYAKLAAFRTERLPESLYRIGETYEEFARAWAVQEMPVLDPIAKAIKEKTINERTSRIYREALAAYLGGLRVLDRLLLEKKSAAGNGSGSAAPVADTVYALARSWSGQIHSKISEMLFRDAEIRTETIQRLLSAPVPGELNNLARLEYRSQVLVKVIKPQTDAAVDAHRRNLVVSDSLGLVNAWVDSSRSRILPLLCLMSEQYRALAWDALRGIRRDYAEFDAAVESRKPVSDEWADRLLGRLEMLKSYGLAVLVFAKDGLARSARIGIRPPERVSFQDAVMRFAVDQTDTLEARINGVQKGHRKAVELFQQTKDPGWENCTFVFEDAETAIREFMLSMLREAFAAEREFEARSPSAGWVAVRLVQMDASEAEQWDLKLEEKTVRTDTTWGVVSDLRPFPARSPRAAPDSLPPLAGNGQIGPDSGMDGAMAITGSPTDTLFARYAVQTAFEIPGFPAWSQAAFMTDTPVRLTLNGTASADSLRAGELDVTKSLRPGKNAVRLEFGENKSFRVAGAIRIRYLSQFAVPQGEP